MKFWDCGWKARGRMPVEFMLETEFFSFIRLWFYGVWDKFDEEWSSPSWKSFFLTEVWLSGTGFGNYCLNSFTSF